MSLTGVMIDSREPSHILNLKFGGVPKLQLALDCGDLWVATDDGAMLVIERKTPADLLGSIKDGRLFQQVAAIRQKTKWGYVMITGVLAHTLDGNVICDNRTTGWRFDAVQGALLDVQEMGVAVVVCQSDQHYEEAVLRLARRERGEEKAIAPRVQPHVLTEAEKILISLPGIGLERAGLILGEFGSVAHGLAWLTWQESIEQIPGIGEITKENVRRALGLKPEEWLTVFYPEAAEYAAKELLQPDGTPVLAVQ